MAVAVKGDTTLNMRIDETTYYVNNQPFTLDVPAQIINDRTMVPARACAEAFGCKVDWDQETKTVIITTPDYVQPAEATPAPTAEPTASPEVQPTEEPPSTAPDPTAAPGE